MIGLLISADAPGKKGSAPIGTFRGGTEKVQSISISHLAQGSLSPKKLFPESDTPPSPGPSIAGHTSVMFRWIGKAKEVSLALVVDNYSSKISLSKNGPEFTGALELPAGLHYYRFHVDGAWVTASDQNTDIASDGIMANFVEVQTERSSLPREASGSPPGDYSHVIPSQDEYAKAKEPPLLPVHLHRALLNSPPVNTDSAMLPVPAHVQLNHLYSALRTDGVLLLGMTHRYRAKFVTTVFYTKNTHSPATVPA